MGEQNKLLLPIGGEFMIRKFVKSVCASDVDDVLVVVGHEAEKIKGILEGQPVRFVANPRYLLGMTTSIQSGVRAVSPESDGLLICLSDMPFAQTSDFNCLIHAFNDFRIPEGSLIVVPVFQGKRGNPVLFSREFREEILQHKGEGCREILEKYQYCIREVMMENDNVFRDVDTPEDYILNSRS